MWTLPLGIFSLASLLVMVSRWVEQSAHPPASSLAIKRLGLYRGSQDDLLV